MLVLQSAEDAVEHSKAIVSGIKDLGGAALGVIGLGKRTRRRRLSYDDRKWISTEIVMDNVAQVLADDCRSVLITTLSSRLCKSRSFPTCRLKTWHSKPRSVRAWRSSAARCVTCHPRLDIDA